MLFNPTETPKQFGEGTARQWVLRIQAEEVLRTFRKMGITIQGGDSIGNGVTFVGTEDRWTNLVFLRTVRKASLLEREGVLVPDTDRMGRFVGWHISTNWTK